ncbi:MAG: hypothetical protein KGJ06_09540 [Pseudomonadota bacterium]|nr:hypothetical protein [Pseudomonadota bacterium]
MSIGAEVSGLAEEFGLTAITAAEIEFYLSSAPSDAFWDTVKSACAVEGIRLFKIEKERGKEQYEVALRPEDPLLTARHVTAVKAVLDDAATRHGLIVDFAARPFAEQPGSGLHIHVHLLDESGKRVFFKNDEIISDALKFSIGGLLATMKDYMGVFAPGVESLARFTPGGNAPLTVSWGANNRTVAVRLPDSEHDEKRIEHRVAGADADPRNVIVAILAGIRYGLQNKCDPGQQIYGDAGLEMYGLPKLI